MQSYNSHLLSALTQVEYWRYRRLALIASLLLLEATAFLTLSLLSKENPLLQTWQIGQPVTSLDFSPDGKLLALGTENGVVQVRQVTSGTLLYTQSGLGPLTFSPDGKVLISGAGNGSLQVWDASTGALVHTLSGNGYMPSALAFSPKGNVLASLGLEFSGDPSGVVHLWDTSDWQLTKTLNLKVSPSFLPKGIAFADDGQTLLVGSEESRIHRWQLPDGSPMQTVDVYPPYSTSGDANLLDFAPGGETVAVAPPGSIVYVLQVSEAQLIQQFGDQRERIGHRGDVWSIAFSPSGARLASGGGFCDPVCSADPSDTTVRIWSLPNRREQAVFEGHTDNVRSLAWSPDESIVASGSDDGTVRLWKIK